MRIGHANGEDGGIFIGICDAAGLNAWGLELYEGTLFRTSRNESLRPVVRVAPPGWPNGHGKQLLVNERGRPAGLRRRANGSVVEVSVEHRQGTLGYRVNGGPPMEAITGFPKGAALRPWVSLYMSVNDRVMLEPVPPFY